ncbi:MAG TPA: hypothetical protein VJB13_05095 [Candidatus Nanoarchaeia archaeon]|nr:hypothetical protein [Candidatus Nanoarchaeia archaeon]
MKTDLTKIILLSATLSNCTTWRISTKFPYEDDPGYNRDCSRDIAPQIEVDVKNKTISIYDPDNKIEYFGWDLDKKFAYARDECGAFSIVKHWK